VTLFASIHRAFGSIPANQCSIPLVSVATAFAVTSLVIVNHSLSEHLLVMETAKEINVLTGHSD
jgi:hypothetical protein